MPFFLASLGGMLISLVGSFVGRILVSLGISIITYAGLSTSLGWLKTQAITAAGGLGADVLGLLSILKVGNCVSIIFSAMLARQVINGLNSDTFKRMVFK